MLKKHFNVIMKRIDFENEKQVKIVAGLLVVFFVFCATTSIAIKSLTVDESVYIPAGYSYLKTADYRLNPEHPVFGKMVLALPLLFLNPELPLEKPTWIESTKMGNNIPNYGFAADFYAANLDNFFPIVFSARLMQIFLGVFLGVLVFSWSKKLFGNKAALLALFFYALSPNILAHSRIAALDFTLTVFVFAAFYFAFLFTCNGKFLNLFLSAFFLSAASLTKFSGLFFVPVLFLFYALYFKRLKKNKPKFLKKKNLLSYYAFIFAFIILLLVFFVNAIYAFDNYNKPNYYGIIPARMYDGYKFISSWVQNGRQGYLLGKFGDFIPEYFLAAFILKTPVAFILLLSFSVYVFAKKRKLDSFAVLLPALLFFVAVSFFSRFYLGLRYVLPVYPFLFVFASQCTCFPAIKKNKKAKAVFVLLILWFFFSSVSIYPNYLAYFNELCGGPSNAPYYLTDSNIDWGQDLFQLMAFVKQNNIKNLNLIYFGIAVSIVKITGIFDKDNKLRWLLGIKPKAKIGWSIYYYELK